VAGGGAQVDDPVGVGHQGLVVLDDDDRLAGFHQAVEQAEEVLDSARCRQPIVVRKHRSTTNC